MEAMALISHSTHLDTENPKRRSMELNPKIRPPDLWENAVRPIFHPEEAPTRW